MRAIKHIQAFVLGIMEFREGITTNPGEWYITSYDRGRELAHRLTLRRWDW